MSWTINYSKMLRLTHKVTIAQRLLRGILSVAVNKSIEELSDTAKVSVNAMVEGRALELEKQVTAGQPIRIELGYDDQNKLEFSGYIVAVEVEGALLKIDCEDAMYLLRKPVKSEQLTKTNPSSIAEKVLAQVLPSASVVAAQGVSDILFDSFTISNATAWEVLKKVKSDTKINIYMRQNKLFLSLRYLADDSTKALPPVRYNFEQNVEKSNLKYRTSEQTDLQVTIVGLDNKNKPVRASAGKPGQETQTLQRYNVSNKPSLQKIAEETAKKWSYQGYEGSLTGWLHPYCTYGQSAKIIDPLYAQRQGTYFIERVKVKYSQKGGAREVFLSKKLA